MNYFPTAEELQKAVTTAKGYDLRSLLTAIFCDITPDEVRRALMQCYFYISSREAEENTENTMCWPLSVLQEVVTALDKTERNNVSCALRIIAADEAAEAAQLREKLKEISERAETDLNGARHDRQTWQKLAEAWQVAYDDLYRISFGRLAPDEQEAHQKIKDKFICRAHAINRATIL